MALIECKHCGKSVSDKASTCPQCGGSLIEETIENTKKICEECGHELEESMTVCPNCGCPIPQQVEEETTQKVEVTAINIPMKKIDAKKVVISIVLVLLAIASIFAGIKFKEKKDAEQAALDAAAAVSTYQANARSVSGKMLASAAEAETVCNLIKSVWYNAIYEERDTTTDKYTRPKGYFVDDFNEALGNLFSDSSFTSDIKSIENDKSSIASTMKDLRNPPEGCEELYEALKEYHDAYLELVNMAINPSGNLGTYSSSFSEADNEVIKTYESFLTYLD